MVLDNSKFESKLSGLDSQVGLKFCTRLGSTSGPYEYIMDAQADLVDIQH